MNDHFSIAFILALSIIIQAVAAIMALRLIGITGRRAAWSLIAVALLFMAVRRVIPLYHLILGDLSHPPDPLNEVVGLFLSAMMAVGIMRIAPIFSERKQAEQEIHYWASIIHTLPDAVCSIDLVGNIVSWNKGSEIMLGYPPEEILGKPLKTIIPEGLVHTELEHCLGILNTDGHFTGYESERQAKDGRIVPVEITAVALKDKDQNIVRYASIMKDVTERKKVEASLQESEKRYRTLFESAGDAIFILDAEGEKAGTIVATNKTAAEMHGYTVDELTQLKIQDIDTPASARKSSDMVRRMLGGEWIKSEEMTHRRKDGTVFFVEVSAGLLELGDHKYILAFDRDVMARKYAENRLLHIQETLQKILSATPYGVVVMGMDKKIRSANQAALDLMGYDSEERIVGALCYQTFCPYDEDLCPNIDLQLTVNQVENILVRKDGTHVHILKTIVPIEIDGEQVLLEAFIDITDQKSAEKKLQQYAEELKESNADILSFSYIVSHDLRAPLVSIRGFSNELEYSLKDIESIIDRCTPHLTEQERTQLATTYRKDVPVAVDFIKSSVNRMDGLINAILVLSRIGHRELKLERVDIRQIVQSILDSLAHQIEQRKTVVTLGELPTVTADKLAMEQIMGNLLDNALKYLDPAREGRIAITAEQNGDGLVFQVKDNGRGIAKEDMHKVFEIFRRAGKQDVPGEGMGLAYVKTLVRRHGGRISCESEGEGKGCCFKFTLPAATTLG